MQHLRYFNIQESIALFLNNPALWLIPLLQTILMVITGLSALIFQYEAQLSPTFLFDSIQVLPLTFTYDTVAKIGIYTFINGCSYILSTIASTYIFEKMNTTHHSLLDSIYRTFLRFPTLVSLTLLHTTVFLASQALAPAVSNSLMGNESYALSFIIATLFIWNIATFYVVPLIARTTLSLFACIQQSLSLLTNTFQGMNLISISTFSGLHVFTSFDIIVRLVVITLKWGWRLFLYYFPTFLYYPMATGMLLIGLWVTLTALYAIITTIEIIFKTEWYTPYLTPFEKL